jgi:hypothetical protein
MPSVVAGRTRLEYSLQGANSFAPFLSGDFDLSFPTEGAKFALRRVGLAPATRGKLVSMPVFLHFLHLGVAASVSEWQLFHSSSPVWLRA